MRISIFKQTLDRVGCNVLNSMGFRVAALNIFRADRFFEVAWGEGDAECCAALLGTPVPLNDWSGIEAAAESCGDSIYSSIAGRRRNGPRGLHRAARKRKRDKRNGAHF